MDSLTLLVLDLGRELFFTPIQTNKDGDFYERRAEILYTEAHFR